MFDCTELYRELSAIEIDLRQRFRFGYRIAKTIAATIRDIEELLGAYMRQPIIAWMGMIFLV